MSVPGLVPAGCSPKGLAYLAGSAAPLYSLKFLCLSRPTAPSRPTDYRNRSSLGRSAGPKGLSRPRMVGLAVAISSVHPQIPNGPCVRAFSSTTATRLKELFPAAKETAHIRRTPPAWPHHGFTESEMLAVVPDHRLPKTWGDWVAWKLVRLCRWGMDFVTGMRPQQQVSKKNPTTEIIAEKPLTEAQWLIRFIFLESIAGVPGMVAGMLRHLHSLRRMKRDNGWIETLLEESYNERMHLLTFMKMCEPGWFMKIMILGAQGVFFNAVFISYLISPRITHRFVGYLEEEAVHTYSRCIAEIEQNLLPKWADPNFNIPELAVTYWRMPEGKRTMRDLILYIRADEAVHRGVNHTLSNLDQKEDPNPFTSIFKDGSHPTPALKAKGYERIDII